MLHFNRQSALKPRDDALTRDMTEPSEASDSQADWEPQVSEGIIYNQPALDLPDLAF